MKTLLLIASLMVTGLNVHAGIDKGNGGFLYSRTSKKLLDISQTSLLTELDSVLKNRKELTYTSSVCSKPVDLRELNSIVSDLAYSYSAESVGTNPDGKEEKRYFHINNDNKVEATELYFASFIDTYFRYTEETNEFKKELMIAPIRTAIIHESLHLFDYNELESRDCSNELIKAIESYSDKKLKANIASVNLINQDLITKKLFEYKCIEDFRDIEFVQNVRIDGAIDLYSRKVFKCLFKIENGKSLVKEDNKLSVEKMLTGLQNSIYSAKSINDVSRYLDSVIKFSFEQELPTKL